MLNCVKKLPCAFLNICICVLLLFFPRKKTTKKIICFCRWINHHYCATIMVVVSLTWEIKGQPNCAQKQVTIFPLDSKCIVCLYVNNSLKPAQRGGQLFLQLLMMQGVAMLLQNIYQHQSL